MSVPPFDQNREYFMLPSVFDQLRLHPQRNFLLFHIADPRSNDPSANLIIYALERPTEPTIKRAQGFVGENRYLLQLYNERSAFSLDDIRSLANRLDVQHAGVRLAITPRGEQPHPDQIWWVGYQWQNGTALNMVEHASRVDMKNGMKRLKLHDLAALRSEIDLLYANETSQ